MNEHEKHEHEKHEHEKREHEKHEHEKREHEKREHEKREHEKREHQEFRIQIDRTHYEVKAHHLTGAELRRVPKIPIGPERDLFEVVPGGTDQKIADNQTVEIRDGMRFFTAPAQINPGSE